MLVWVSDWDQTAFVAQIETYRRELHVHCYRLMGSIQDADDMVQETLLRAWRRRESIEKLSSLRAWLYKVATNICLDALKQRPKRRIPATHEAEAALTEPILPEIFDLIWLEPYPDAPLLAANEQNPEDLVIEREDITLAFIAVLHLLPPRQRAVLLLRDVLDCSASEVAALLETTIPAVKSALHRARSILAQSRVNPDADLSWRIDSTTEAQLASYVAAWETADIDAFVRLLKDDATFSMPPIPSWYRGKETIRVLVTRTVFGGQARGRWRLLPTCANGQPAFGVYRETSNRRLYAAYGIQVVTLADHAISDVITFRDPALVARFGLPSTLSEKTV
jgi:RNA polymerase sigma-70 factor (ECF subfamily)